MVAAAVRAARRSPPLLLLFGGRSATHARANISTPPPPHQPHTYHPPSPKQPPIVATDDNGAPLRLYRSYLGGSHATDVTADYELLDNEILGTGAFATVRAAVERATGRRAAVKSVHKRRLEGLAREWADARREVQVMALVGGHPNVPTLLGAYEDAHYVHLVMERCAGGGLLERVVERGPRGEREAAALAHALLSALAHAHDLGACHRDVKLDNLLLADGVDGSEGGSGHGYGYGGRDEAATAARAGAALRLVDWGFGAFVRPGAGRLRGLCGTSYYIAPEVLTGGPYDEQADVWSAGVVLYALLCGRPPFDGGRTEAIFRQIVDDGVPDMCAAPWPGVSDAAKDLVRRLMTWHPSRRPTAAEALAHEWFVACGVPAAVAAAAAAAAASEAKVGNGEAGAAAVAAGRLASSSSSSGSSSRGGSSASLGESGGSGELSCGGSGSGSGSGAGAGADSSCCMSGSLFDGAPLSGALSDLGALPAADAPESAAAAAAAPRSELLARLRRTAAAPPARRAAARAAAARLPADATRGLRELFAGVAGPVCLAGPNEGRQAADCDDLLRALQKRGAWVARAEAAALLAAADGDGDGLLGEEDFVAAALPPAAWALAGGEHPATPAGLFAAAAANGAAGDVKAAGIGESAADAPPCKAAAVAAAPAAAVANTATGAAAAAKLAPLGACRPSGGLLRRHPASWPRMAC